MIDLFHELGNQTAQFTKWSVSQIGRNIYTVSQKTPSLFVQ